MIQQTRTDGTDDHWIRTARRYIHRRRLLWQSQGASSLVFYGLQL